MVHPSLSDNKSLLRVGNLLWNQVDRSENVEAYRLANMAVQWEWSSFQWITWSIFKEIGYEDWGDKNLQSKYVHRLTKIPLNNGLLDGFFPVFSNSSRPLPSPNARQVHPDLGCESVTCCQIYLRLAVRHRLLLPLMPWLFHFSSSSCCMHWHCDTSSCFLLCLPSISSRRGEKARRVNMIRASLRYSSDIWTRIRL